MNQRRTVLLLAVLIILLAFVYATEPGIFGKAAATPSPEPDRVQILNLDAARIQRITVRDNVQQLTTEVARDGESWRVVQPVSDEGDRQRIEGVVVRLADLQASRKLEGISEADLGAFGLVTATYSIIIGLEGGNQETLRVGDRNPLSTAYYVQKAGDVAVYLVPTFDLETLTGFIGSPPVKPTPTTTLPPSPTPETPAAPGRGPAMTNTPDGTSPAASTSEPSAVSPPVTPTP